MTAIEYEHEAIADRAERLQLLHEGPHALRVMGPAKSQAAQGLAEDYMILTNQILDAFTEPRKPDIPEPATPVPGLPEFGPEW